MFTHSLLEQRVRLWQFTLGALLVVLLSACGSQTASTPTPTATLPAATATPSPIPPVAVAVATLTPTVAPSPTGATAPRPSPTGGAAQPRPAGATGKVAYSVVTEREPKFHTIWVADANGANAHQILTHAQWPAFSPDGSRIAYYGRPEGKSEGLYVADSGGNNPVLAVISPGVCCLDWSRDGQWIVYALSGRPNQPGGPIWKVKVDGVYQTRVDLKVMGNGPAFSPDSKQVVYSGSFPNQDRLGLMIVSADGGTPRQITTDNGGNAQWSPDGRRIVYQARDNANAIQVFVINPDGSNRRQLTHGKSNDGQPIWSRDGNHIFWRSDQNGTAWAIYVMVADGTGPRKILDNVPPEPDLWGWESLSIAP